MAPAEEDRPNLTVVPDRDTTGGAGPPPTGGPASSVHDAPTRDGAAPEAVPPEAAPPEAAEHSADGSRRPRPGTAQAGAPASRAGRWWLVVAAVLVVVLAAGGVVAVIAFGDRTANPEATGNGSGASTAGQGSSTGSSGPGDATPTGTPEQRAVTSLTRALAADSDIDRPTARCVARKLVEVHGVATLMDAGVLDEDLQFVPEAKGDRAQALLASVLDLSFDCVLGG